MYLFLTAMIALDTQDLHAAEEYTTNTGDIDNKLELSFHCQNRVVSKIKSWKESHPKHTSLLRGLNSLQRFTEIILEYILKSQSNTPDSFYLLLNFSLFMVDS